ncbi:hypothetical protein FF011L_13790 [Roseimaritima multifibrata]|uniref:Thioredoxin domain-containing protein n=1 Tax=Roseimaritima multifibrata TaxID=1930274 RepID=A0A517MCM0_9BACT|nr:SCO family protein [Roseimaritima multifibrata]QDS92632.1 hypothetical protein FF011L_13790 [Roseimaritima multifibrata]
MAQPGTESGTLNNGVPAQVKGVDVEQHLGVNLPLDLEVTDSEGKTARLAEYFDGKRPVIVTLNYSDCPVLCSVQLNALTRSLNELNLRLGDDFQILTVSIDPDESTERISETKALYVGQVTEQPDVAQAWHFATAEQSVITELTDTLGFKYRLDPVSKQFNHPAMLAFVTPNGEISNYSLRIDFPAEDLKRSLIAAGEGEIGSPVDQIVMWCFSYDPNLGKYTAEAWKLMRLGGLLTVVIVLVALIPYWLGKRKTQADSATPDQDETEPVDSASMEP